MEIDSRAPSVHEIPRSRVIAHPGARFGMFALAWVCVAVGLAGVVLPLVPSTVMLLLALWAFSRSSDRFHEWLYRHPRLGRPLRDWHAHGTIPPAAKIAALATMAFSLGGVTYLVADGWIVPSLLGALFAAIGIYIVSRPSRLPTAAQ